MPPPIGLSIGDLTLVGGHHRITPYPCRFRGFAKADSRSRLSLARPLIQVPFYNREQPVGGPVCRGLIGKPVEVRRGPATVTG